MIIYLDIKKDVFDESLLHSFLIRGHSTTTWTRRGGGGQQKVHACPPRGGSLDVHVDKNLKEMYRTIMANYYEKS